MRVLHLYSGNLFGGVERMLLALWRRREDSPMRHAFGLCFEGRLAGSLRDAGAGVELLGPARLSRPWTVAAARARVRRVVAGGGFDVAIAHGLWAHAVLGPAVREAGVPLVLWVHDVPRAGGLLERLAGGTLPARVVASSRFVVSRLPGRLGALPWAVCHPLIELPERAESAGGGGGTVILMCARMQRGKGHAVLLEALGRLRDLRRWECRIAGGPQRSGERAYAARLAARCRRLGLRGRVQFLGHREDVARLLCGAAVFCHPHTEPEGFGLAIAEAMSAGVAVIASDSGGTRELIAPGSGLLVRPGDAGALTGALRVLLESESLRRQLGQCGRRRAEYLQGRSGAAAVYEILKGAIERPVEPAAGEEEKCLA